MVNRLKVIAGILNDGWKRPAACEACGSSFTCGATLSGCWCSDLKLDKEDREALKARFKNCLCPACLNDVKNIVKSVEPLTKKQIDA